MAHPAGDLVQRVERDVDTVAEVSTDVVYAIVRMVIMFNFTVTTMLILDWRLTSLVVPLLPPFVFVRPRYRIILHRASAQVGEAMEPQRSLLCEVLTGVVQIRLLGAPRRLSRRHTRLNLRTMRVNMVRRRAERLFTRFAMSLTLGRALIIGIGGARVIFGGLTANSLVASYRYIGDVFAPFKTAVELHARNRARASLRRRSTHCAAHADTRAAIVEERGDGTSTVLKLFPRLYDVETGSVTIDGVDLRRAQDNGLRRSISVVPQDPVRRQGTRHDHLRHARLTASRADLARVA